MFLTLLEIGSSSTVLVVIALIIIIGYISTAIFKRTRVPELLILMLIGIFLVQVLHAVSTNYLDVLRSLAPVFSSLALVVIMFNGSKGLKLGDTALRSWKGMTLGLLDVFLSMIAISVLVYYVFGWPLLYGAILGAILGETASIVVIPFIRKVKLSPDIFGAMFVETTTNSIAAIAIFSLLLILANNQSLSAFSFTTYILDYISFAVVMGLVAGICWFFVADILKGAREYIAILAIAILLYGFVDIFNGAAIISVMIFGLVIGNEKALAEMLKLHSQKNPINEGKDASENANSSKSTMQMNEKAVEKELEFLISTFFFVFMGMITVLSVQYLIYGLLISLILILVRYLEVRAVLYKNINEERKLAFALLPRGVTVATLATILYGIGGIYFMQTFYISFIVIVVTSIVSSLMLNRVSVEVNT